MLNIKQIASESFALLSYVLTDPVTQESVVIDPPAGMGDHIDLKALRVKTVVNTHIHPDHTMGNHLFADRTPILAHSGDSGFFHRMASSSLSALFTARIPPKISFTLSEGTMLSLGRTTIRVMHTPGHSPGSICLFWPGNLITGDTIFVEGIGRTDIPGGSLSDIRQSIERILALPEDTRIWPGHYYGGRYTATLKEIGPSLRRIAESIR
ncbi:MAG: putative polyketide biosynthesis zinc-dependent hydrolase BaeB [Deltaproteobacteria bacterium ADurb.BinA179]|mgnify:FL=1|jgi:glyoxylase-like metal-dependent hydrolase (beta-lactamase superfamily II)|nr:MBL fold metallo-hydrolase [Deltaproteobacteria bacterium]MDI9544033.1 MBL fold metallo-hydrolase [Pseudomonadota bacterium]NLW67115.1 MBL fold metallo-hydrolase [Bacteriovoracaceae bacterium]OPZ28837.1 MAG: putative polyketide biosynthesis zinc-dependent hydrolase BaeB [Deltaproteobacteria bacterium ADurb.BinA179]HRR19953.1 MBL fold metallo-hydrolase [Desulfomonilia bacterium]